MTRHSPLDIDGMVVHVAGNDFELHAEMTEDGGAAWAVCQSCGQTVKSSPVAMEVHTCVRCSRCAAVCVDVVYDEMQQSYLPPMRWETWCSDDCHDASAETWAQRQVQA